MLLSGLEILHGGEGGDVELEARTSEHIIVFAFDPLVSFALSVSFILCKASSIRTFHIISSAFKRFQKCFWALNFLS